MPTVHIIGAGVSGLSAACALAGSHVPVKLYEASAVAGGRARSSSHASLGATDHGLHLLPGWATHSFRFLDRIGAREQLIEVPRPYRFLDPKTRRAWSLSPRRPLPTASLADLAPLARLLAMPDTATAGRFFGEENSLRGDWARNFARLRLHTPLAALSARSLRRTFLRSLRRGQLYMVKHSLRASFIEPALEFLEYCGGSVYFSHSLTRLDEKSLSFARKKVMLAEGDVVILAVPPSVAASLLPALKVPTSSHNAITFHFAADHGEPAGTLRFLTRGPVDLVRYDEGVLRAALRVADNEWHADPKLLAERVWTLLRRSHPRLDGAPLPEFAVWREKRAGHLLDVATAGLPTISREPTPRCLLAGDWLEPGEPATLESAIASGHLAAERARELIGERSSPTQAY